MEYNEYRLGDTFNFHMHLGYKLYLKNFEYQYELFPESFGGRLVKYIIDLGHMPKSESILESLLLNMIQTYNKEIQPKNTELVIHCRVGDVIEDSTHTVGEHLRLPLAADAPGMSPHIYVQPLSYYEEVLLRCPIHIQNVRLVAGGVVRGGNTAGTKSKEYIHKLTTWFESKGLSVQSTLGGNPDEDFVYMCRAQNFVGGGGGFTQLIRRMREKLDYNYKFTF
jgi:hypothetical protein